MTMRLTRRALLAGSSAALIAPCTARAATVTDDTGRVVTVPAKVEHVYPAGLPAAILLYMLAPELLLGWPRANTPQACAYMLPDICARPEVARITGRGDISPESITALKPDLILDVGSTGPRYSALAEQVQQQTQTPYALVSGGILSLSTSYEKLGRLIGREAAGADFGDYCNMTLGAITNRIAFVPAEKRPRVYSARGPRGLTTALGHSCHAELIELLARNVAGGSTGELGEVTVEQIRQWDPDVIVTINAEFAASVRGDPAWASIKAVREGRVHLMAGIPFGWFDAPPSGNRLIGLWWLGKILYPDLFKEDLRELTRDFYEKFYHVKPTEPRLDYVLAGKS
jgi:iron complex transport system substrate-binding protein